MRNTKINSLLFCLFFISLTLHAQIKHRGCVTHALDSIRRAEHPEYDKARKLLEKKIQERKKNAKAASTDTNFIYTIPVVVHIIYNPTNSSSNISEEEVLEQIQVLNDDFRRWNIDAVETPDDFKSVAADTKIQFCLANTDPNGDPIDKAIIRVPSPQNSYNYLSDDERLKAISYWPSDQYLNIWVTTLTDNVLGYAQFPSESDLAGLTLYWEPEETDGVVIDYRVFGVYPESSQIYNLGRTLTHEVGHWLGLIHIFGEHLSCDTDFVDDTPTQGVNNEGLVNCDTLLYSCGSNKVMYQNYMDYTSDRCMNLFTKGQRERMHTALVTSPRRAALLSSTGCCGNNAELITPPFEERFGFGFEQNGWDDSTFADDAKWIISNHNFNDFAFSSSNSGTTNGLVSPHFNFKNTKTPTLEFDYAYNGSNTSDQIVIEYEANCSETWYPLKTISGSSLSNRAITGAPSDNEWRNAIYYLPEVGNKNLIRFRISSNLNDGAFYLDNLNLYNTSVNFEADLYPNPATSYINLDASFLGDQELNFQVYNNKGELVLSTDYLPHHSTIFSISTEQLPAGIYFLKAYVNDQTFSGKFHVQ